MPNDLIGSGPIRNQPGPFRDLLLAAGMTPVDWPGQLPLSAADYCAVLPEIDAIIARRDHILVYVDKLIAKYGEDAVLAFP